MNPQLFEGLPISFRDEAVKKELESGRVVFTTLKNNGSYENYEILTGLKVLFQKQLPKMPKEYITRLVYDRKHESLALIRDYSPPGPESIIREDFEYKTVPAYQGSVIGGITYRLFPEKEFCEIVFCAISSDEQVKGFGATLMCQLKASITRQTFGLVKHYLTYADNYAIGYFKKQGFSTTVSLDRDKVWGGLIKDYDGGTLMQCSVIPGIDYLTWYNLLHSQKLSLISEIDHLTKGCSKKYQGLPADFFDGANVSETSNSKNRITRIIDRAKNIPGLLESGWNPEDAKRTLELIESNQTNNDLLYDMMKSLLNELQTHPAAWPFLKPVNKKEVPQYYEMIQYPMDLETMERKLEAENKYIGLPNFISDFKLIISNCMLFNDPNTSYCKNARNLEKFFEERLKARQSRI